MVAGSHESEDASYFDGGDSVQVFSVNNISGGDEPLKDKPHAVLRNA